MPHSTVDPRWAKVLSLAVHEFRTPMTVVSGYIRMLLKERAGPLTDQQRKLLEEAEKSCVRLSALIAEVSELSSLEGGTATFNRLDVDLRAILREAVDGLPETPDRPVAIDLQLQPGPAASKGDAVRLKSAFTSVLTALRRELIASSTLVVREIVRPLDDTSASWLAIADPDRITGLADADLSTLTTFDEWRGGCGMTLANARRIFEAHQGRIWSPAAESKAGAVIALPHLRE
jgi:signal transduction histidine kinase